MAAKRKTPKMKMSPAARKVVRHEMDAMASRAAEAAVERRNQIARFMRTSVPVVDESALKDREVSNGVAAVLRLIASTYPDWNRNTVIRVRVSDYGRVSGWTDFRTVNVSYPRDKMFCDTLGSFDHPVTREALREVLGVGYHEVGHCLFTLPMADLALPGAEYKTAWNWLEDQRMEMAVVRSSPAIAAYFTLMVTNVVVAPGTLDEAWWLLCGRLYLPKRLRRAAREHFVEQYGDEAARRVERVVRDYCEADTVAAMREAVVKAHLLMQELRPEQPAAAEDHAFAAGANQFEDMAERAAAGAFESDDDDWDLDEDEEWDEDDLDVVGGGESTEDEDASKEPGDGVQQDEGEPTEPGESQAGSGSPQEDGQSADEQTGPLEQAAQEAAEEAAREADAGDIMRQAMRSLVESAGTGESGFSSLTRSYGSERLNNDLVQQAEGMAHDFVRALEAASAYNQPTWKRRQDRGGIDAVAYRTRRPGETDYRRQIVGSGHEGIDMAVSLVLDTSGSMSSHVAALSVTAYAVKKACWEVGVPCSVSTYNSVCTMRSTADDEPEPSVFHAAGATRIGEALQALPEQRAGKSDHLVLVLSDGHIADGRESFGVLRATYDAYIIGIGLGRAGAEALADKGCDDVYGITEPEQIAGFVEDYLAAVVSKR